MRLLSLDVSSTCTGWALLIDGRVMRFGIIKGSPSEHSVDRIDYTVYEAQCLARAETVDAVVMEWSSGKVHGRLGRASGLAILGQAQGAVREGLNRMGLRPHLVTENEWTRGRRKDQRAANLMMICPEYRAAANNDKGYDAADAIQIGLWWFDQQRKREILKHAL